MLNVVNKLEVPVRGHTEIPRGECHRHEIWNKEKTMWFGYSDSNWEFWWWCRHLHRQIMAFHLHMCSDFPVEKVDNCDVIKWCHSDLSCYWGREVYEESELKPLSCCLGFWHWMVGSLVKSPTLYSGYLSTSYGARIYPRWIVYLVYSSACAQTFLGTF